MEWLRRDVRLGVPAATGAGLLVAAGVALRVYVYRSALGRPDSDEAVVGLMARHVTHGQLTAFFWGQGYGGSQEAVLTAPVFLVFGSSWLALRIVPILLTAATAVLVWQVGRRLFGELPGVVAGAVAWLWPPFAVYKTTHQWGFYASGSLYAALLLLLAIRTAGRPTLLRTALFGLVCGLALWQDIQLVPIVAPAVLWLVWRRPSALRHGWLAVPAAVLGGLPWLLWNLHHRFGSFQTHITAGSSYVHRLRVFGSPLLPMLIGLRTPFSQQPLVSGALVDLALLALVAAFAYGAWRTRGSDASLLYAVAIAFPFVYAISRQTLFSSEPRYLLVLSPVLALLVAQAARTPLRALPIVGAAAALSGVTLYRMDGWQRTAVPTPPIAPTQVGPLIAALDHAGIDRAYAHYWAAYLIDFETRERVVAAESKLTSVRFAGGRAMPPRAHSIRWRPYERVVRAAPRAAFVFVLWPADTNRGKRLRVMARLVARGFTRQRFGDLVLLLPPAARG